VPVAADATDPPVPSHAELAERNERLTDALNMQAAEVAQLRAEVERLRGVEQRYRARLERDAAAQRKAYRRKHPKVQPKPAQLLPCGTSAAYQRHRKAGEQPCAPCREAWREYQAAYHAKRKAAADAH
jgi:predicted component of type VI protein secretion system